ncbi:MAG: adenylyltransferase/cytidyltransferase family protein [Spirochaetia bacterium]
MKSISWTDFVQDHRYGDVPSAVTVGVFDGVHIGHQKLIGRILEKGGLEPVIVTFLENPSKFFHPRGFLGNISTLEQKLAYFDYHGAGLVILIDFSPDFSKLSGRRFIRLISEHLGLRYLAVGVNFHCGRDNDTNAFDIKEMLEESRIGVDIIDPVCYKGERVSSTRIRKELLRGNVEDVRKMLGKPYALDISSRRSIRGSRIPLSVFEQIIPPAGEYRAGIKTYDKEIETVITIHSQFIEIPDIGTEIREIDILENT